MSSSVDFWYLRISRSATVPGRYLHYFSELLVLCTNTEGSKELARACSTQQTETLSWQSNPKVCISTDTQSWQGKRRDVPVGLLDAAGGRRRLTRSLGGQLLARRLAAGGLARCLLRTGHGWLQASAGLVVESGKLEICDRGTM